MAQRSTKAFHIVRLKAFSTPLESLCKRRMGRVPGSSFRFVDCRSMAPKAKRLKAPQDAAADTGDAEMQWTQPPAPRGTRVRLKAGEKCNYIESVAFEGLYIESVVF